MLLSAHLSALRRQVFLVRLLALVLLFNLTACAGSPLNQIFLMPAPDVYTTGAINPFTDMKLMDDIPYEGILYATDREPAKEGDREDFYLNKRGFLLRLGLAQIKLSGKDISWEQAREISLLKNRTDKYPLKITGSEEFGILEDSYSIFMPPEVKGPELQRPGRIFAGKVNEKLAASTRKDIYIYVHGFKVVFENPLLVAAELWHFLGYDGVFIAYAWPSTPKNLAYFSDLETTLLSSNNFRIFLEYLARETRAENIHIIGYSAGTRLVINALNQLALIYKSKARETFRQDLRIGHVILTASDFDRQLFGAYIVNGILNMPKDLTVYLSQLDSALSLSRWLFRRDRLGQMWEEGIMTGLVAEQLRKTEGLIFIDVTDAEGTARGNGHAYFRKSPWVSSDILSTLMYDLSPEERGLYRTSEGPAWKFPEDYIDRLSDRLVNLNPALAPLKEQQQGVRDQRQR